MEAFVRSPSGQAAKHHFHERVTIWVEGEDDLLVFRWLAEAYPARLEMTGGKSRAKQLIEQLKEEDAPFVVITDGDYEILTSSRSPHRRAVRLGRYSVENYFVERDLLAAVYAVVAGPDGLEELLELFDAMVEQVESELEEAIALDVASVRSEAGVPVLPRSPGRLMPVATNPQLDLEAIKAIVTRVQPVLDKSAIQAAREDVRAWRKNNRLIDIWCGHLAFAAVRRVLVAGWRKAKGKTIVDNEILFGMLAKEAWSRNWSGAQRRLRNRITRAVRDALTRAA